MTRTTRLFLGALLFAFVFISLEHDSARAAVNLEILAIDGGQVPGLAPGNIYETDEGSAVFHGPMNESGTTVFGGILSGPDVTKFTDIVHWKYENTGLSPVVRDGDSVPGSQAGATFLRARVTALTSQGKAIVLGTPWGGEYEGTGDSGVWSIGDDASRLILQTGDNVPGAEAGITVKDIRELGGAPVAAGEYVLIQAVLQGPGIDQNNDLGFYLDNAAGTLGKVLQEGDTVPGKPSK